MLYYNPRNIGCNICHGDNAKGKKLTEYIQNNKLIVIYAPNIKDISLQQLKDSLTKPKSIMPFYNLTDSEIDAIFYWLKNS